jgi:hypothetical protein
MGEDCGIRISEERYTLTKFDGDPKDGKVLETVVLRYVDGTLVERTVSADRASTESEKAEVDQKCH